MPNDNPQCLAVMYHYVRDRFEPPENRIAGLSIAQFEQQLNAMTQHFEPIGWTDWHDHLIDGKTLPPRSFLLTFDDGLKDHVDVVAPLLTRRGMSGLFFISSRPADQHRMESAHMIHLLLCHLGGESFDRSVRDWLTQHDPETDWFANLNHAEAQRVYHYEPSQRAAFKYLLNVALPIDLRDRMLAELFAAHIGSQTDESKRWYGSWSDWRALIADGNTVGGHGFIHEPYAQRSAVDQIADMRRARETLTEKLAVTAPPMSYPFGSFDETTINTAQQAGFSAAFTTIQGWNQPTTDPFRLHRVDTIAVDEFLSQSDCLAAASH
jgi:peptidoglycan/xylan/chitin deacetylase (PgdA/CDA1 family)